MDLASWAVGLSLIVLTIGIHTTAVVVVAFGVRKRITLRVNAHASDPRWAIPSVIGHIGASAVILAALHGLESLLWAIAFHALGALGSFTDAAVYSLATMTTLDIPALAVPSRFRLLSALEAINGVLLFGISTAFIFAVIQAYWLMLPHDPDSRHRV